MTYAYANAENTSITDGVRFIPVNMDDMNYRKLIADNTPIGPYVAPPAPIPNITATQMLIVLQAMGFITQTEATDRTQFPAAFNALLTGDTAQDAALKIRWANLTLVERSNSLVGAFASLLSLTNEQIDNMFIQAATL